MRYNEAITKDDHLNPYQDIGHYHFIDIYQKPIWYGEQYIEWQTNSNDGGENYANEERHVFMGTYFFLSKESIEHRRTAYNIMNLFSEVGGFAGITVMGLSFFTTEITFQYVIYYFIKHFYGC